MHTLSQEALLCHLSGCIRWLPASMASKPQTPHFVQGDAGGQPHPVFLGHLAPVDPDMQQKILSMSTLGRIQSIVCYREPLRTS